MGATRYQLKTHRSRPDPLGRIARMQPDGFLGFGNILIGVRRLGQTHAVIFTVPSS